MWISVIAGLVCFAVSIILFTPSFRKFTFYRPLSFYFLFEGLWCVINFVVTDIWINTNIMTFIKYIGTILFAGYLFFAMYSYYFKDTGKKGNTDSEKQDKSSLNKKS